MILTNFYNQTPQITTKIIIQLMVLLSFADIIWICLFSGAWVHDSEEQTGSETPKYLLDFWNSLWFLHGFVYFLAYVELILKGLLLYYLIVDYKGKYSIKDLLNMNYEGGQTLSTSPGKEGFDAIADDSMGKFEKELGTNSFAENFGNDY